MDLSPDNATIDKDLTQARLDSFSVYYGYNISVTDNSTSPLNFNPTACMKNESWVLPKVASSIIAIVDPSSNPVMERINQYLTALQSFWSTNNINELTLQNFTSIEELNSYIESESYLYPDTGICFGISVVQSGSTYTASLIFDDQTQYGGATTVGIPPTKDSAYSSYQSQPQIKDYTMINEQGYAFVQNLVATTILQVESGNNNAQIDLMSIPIPSDNIITDQFQQILSSLFPFFLVLIYLGPIYTTTYAIVQEKELRSKESMRMMGMTDLSYWLSWWSFYSLQSTVISFIGWICLCINVMSGGSGYILLYMWLFGMSIFGQIVFYQALFSRAKYSGLVSCIVFFMLEFVNTPIATTGSVGLKAFLSLIPQVTAQQMAVIWSDFETQQVGITKDNCFTQINNYSFGEGLWLYVAGLIFWLAIGFYLEAVLPKEYGTKKHPCFMFFPSTYKGCCKKRVDDEEDEEDRERRSTLLKNNQEDSQGMEARNLKPENYEPVASEVARQALDGQYLRIEGLEKTYDNGFQAVKGLNLKIYKNQIFALLGQNGAGKSTTISMLTGLIQSTKGTATVFNEDMFREPEKVRQFMGICPQHDVLFEHLSPKEHLSVFYDFKGGDPALKEKEITDLIRDVGLTVDQDKQAGSLSGGNKRKLSVAIALCGGSKLVLLDEPTAGMDLGARRDLWNMLKNYRNEKIIILTTHYMDEADVLGDRIGIMAQGKLMCLGTSLFLKKRFGAGYKLTMVKSNKSQNVLIGPYLNENLGSVTLLSEVASEIIYQVSDELASKFTDFFRKFDQELSNLGIVSYGVSITTLEEVFLKINQEFKISIGNSAVEERLKDQTGNEVQEVQEQLTSSGDQMQVPNAEMRGSLNQPRIQQQTVSNELVDNESQQTKTLVGNSTVKTTVKALLVKRFHLYKRDKVGIACEVVVPFILVLIGCMLNGINFSQKSYTIAVDPSLFPAPQRITMNTQSVFQILPNEDCQDLFTNLPGGSSQWVQTVDNTKNPITFYQDVYAQRNVGSSSPFRYGSYQIYKYDQINYIYQFATLMNLTSPVVAAYYPQYMYESILTTAVNVNLNIQTVPYPTMYQLKQRSSSNSSFLFAGYVGFAFCFMPCAIISFILIERVENLRHMQIISGMSLTAYWLSNMIADIIKLYIPIIMIILISIMFDANYQGVWVLFMLLPWALVPFTYITSFLFEKDSTAQIITLFINYFVACVMSILVFVLQFIPQTFKLGGILRWALCIFPSYCVVNGILWSANGQITLQIRATDPSYPQLSDNLWAMCNLGGDALFLCLHFVIDTLILIAIEKNLFSCLRGKTIQVIPPRAENLALDSDVIAEERRVATNTTDVIRVDNFRKAYTTAIGPICLAVERISFGLDYGECFALLGVNGAGKSTTFKSLTAETDPTEGTITVAGYNIQTQFEEARKLIGYCPQKDAIFNLMTVEEHLWFYARIKGIPEDQQQQIVEKAIVELNLADHRSKPAGTLSGGNKRKLSVAMATLGNPPIILLDEPSAGMDPEARRFMWTVVEKISQRDKKSAVILTTHSMEEAEALSTKMGIMVRGGVFKCYGSSQHIKNKFGTGYECEIKISKPTYAQLESVANSIGFADQIDTRISLQEAKETARKANVDEFLIEQIKESGLGSDLVFEAAQGNSGLVRISNFATFIYTMQYGTKLITMLASHFAQVDLIEQCSDFFKIRIPREDKTIGMLFGLIEDQKVNCHISEYSVSQTSLEQIFQTFATQSILQDKAAIMFKLDSLGNLQLVEERRSTLLQRSVESVKRQQGLE